MTTACCSRPSAGHGDCWRAAAPWALTDIFRRLHRSAARWTSQAMFTAQNGVLLGEHDRGGLRLFARGERLQRSAQQRNAIPDQWDAAVALCNRRGLARPAAGDAASRGFTVRRSTFGRRFRAFRICRISETRLAPIVAAKIPSKFSLDAGQ